MARHVPCECGRPKKPTSPSCRPCMYARRVSSRRYPYEPLAELVGGTTAEQAERLGVSHHLVRALKRRGLSAAQADRYAIVAGVHPSLLWPSWFDDAQEGAAGCACPSSSAVTRCAAYSRPRSVGR